MEINHPYIRELFLLKLVQVKYVLSYHDQLADIHTKALSKSRFMFLQSNFHLVLLILSSSAWRGVKKQTLEAKSSSPAQQIKSSH